MESGCSGSEFTAGVHDRKGDMQSADTQSGFPTSSSALALCKHGQSRLRIVLVSLQLRDELPLRSKWEQQFSQPVLSSK